MFSDGRETKNNGPPVAMQPQEACFWRGCMGIEPIRTALDHPQPVLKTVGHTSIHPPPWREEKNYNWPASAPG